MDRRNLLTGFLRAFAPLFALILLNSEAAASDGTVFDVFSGSITAIATMLIAWFTLSLRRSTDKLWTAGKEQLEASKDQLKFLQDSSERQLRAYVHVEKTP